MAITQLLQTLANMRHIYNELHKLQTTHGTIAPLNRIAELTHIAETSAWLDQFADEQKNMAAHIAAIAKERGIAANRPLTLAQLILALEESNRAQRTSAPPDDIAQLQEARSASNHAQHASATPNDLALTQQLRDAQRALADAASQLYQLAETNRQLNQLALDATEQSLDLLAGPREAEYVYARPSDRRAEPRRAGGYDYRM